MCSYKETTRKIKTNKQRKSSKVAKKSYSYANSFDIMKYQQQDQTNKQMVKYCLKPMTFFKKNDTMCSCCNVRSCT